MALQLGRDGASRAIQAATGQSVSALSGLYVGMLDSLDYTSISPGDLGLGELTLSQVTQNEMSVTNFYTPNDRRLIQVGAPLRDENGTYLLNTTFATWTNNTGAIQPVPGFFICDTSNYLNDAQGKILWLGQPSVGSQNFSSGEDISLDIGSLVLRVS